MSKIYTPKFRVSFPSVFEARAIGEGDKKKFSLTMLFNIPEIKKDPEQVKLWDGLVRAVKDAAREEWGDKVPPSLKSPFRDGKEKQEYEGYGEGIIFVVASSLTRPGIVDRNVQRIIDPADFYAGCYARAVVNTYTWKYMGKFGVSIGLQNIQKLEDGDPFGGRGVPEKDFDSVESAAVSDETNATSLFG